MSRKLLITYKDTLFWLSFVTPFVRFNCVLLACILLLPSNSLCLHKILLDETYGNTDDKSCQLEHVNHAVSSTSEINCVYSCSVELHSIGITYNAESGLCKCCSEIKYVTEESQTDTKIRFYTINDAMTDEISSERGTTTNTHEKPRECDDLAKEGISSSGIYEVYADGRNTVNVYCDFGDLDGPWTVIQRRVDGTVSFNRPHKSYQEGFGNLTGNFWIGLDTISSITLQDNKTCTLKVVIIDRLKGKKFAKYSFFQISDSSSHYTLRAQGYSGDAGDELSKHNGFGFAAYDTEQGIENVLTKCATKFLGGWWYKSRNCLECNLNGVYGDDRSKSGISWRSSSVSFKRSVEYATMKLKSNKSVG